MTTQTAGTRAPGAPDSATRPACPAGSAARRVALGPYYACDECFGPLEVSYDFPRLTRADIEAGPHNIWRYAPLLPVPRGHREPPARPSPATPG